MESLSVDGTVSVTGDGLFASDPGGTVSVTGDGLFASDPRGTVSVTGDGLFASDPGGTVSVTGDGLFASDPGGTVSVTGDSDSSRASVEVGSVEDTDGVRPPCAVMLIIDPFAAGFMVHFAF